jgi:hypothetical protein
MKKSVYKYVMGSTRYAAAQNAINDALVKVNLAMSETTRHAVWEHPEQSELYHIDYAALNNARSNLVIASSYLRLAVIRTLQRRMQRVADWCLRRGNAAAAGRWSDLHANLHDEHFWWVDRINNERSYEIERANVKPKPYYARPFLVVEDGKPLNNVFNVFQLVRQVLRRADLRPQAIECGRRLLNCSSDEQAIAMLLSYVEVLYASAENGTPETLDAYNADYIVKGDVDEE